MCVIRCARCDAIRCKLHALCLCTLGHMQSHSLTHTRAKHTDTHTHLYLFSGHSQILERTTCARTARTIITQSTVGANEMRRRSALLKILDLHKLYFAQFDFPLDLYLVGVCRYISSTI